VIGVIQGIILPNILKMIIKGAQSISYGFFLLQEDVGKPVIFLFGNSEKNGGFSTA